ncbi:MAG: arylesterase [Rhodospirillaceae bacterium]|nr:arylesterase [Rhodospirillaceae bacterium]
MAYVHTRRQINRLAFALALLWSVIGAASVEAATRKLMVLGDSLGAGFGLPTEQGFVAQLERALRARGYDITVMNGSISGDTTAGGRARLAWALVSRPDFVIVELGGNDGLRGLDPAQTRANLDAILKRLKEERIPALLAGMLAPRNLGPVYERKFNSVYAELADRYGAILYPFFLDGVALDPKLNQRDLIHPNAKGVAVIVERLLPYVERLVARTDG